VAWRLKAGMVETEEIVTATQRRPAANYQTESRETLPRGPEPRMTVLVRIISNLTEPKTVTRPEEFVWWLRVVRQKNMAMGPARPGTKNGCIWNRKLPGQTKQGQPVESRSRQLQLVRREKGSRGIFTVRNRCQATTSEDTANRKSLVCNCIYL
jgi:hypothetical protein